MGNVGSLTMKFPGKRAVIAAAWPAEAAEWSELLEKLGFSELFCADNGAETLRLVRAELPDVLLADEILPVLDGVTLSERILRAPLAVQPGILLVRPAGMHLRSIPRDCVSLYRPLTAEKIAAAAEAVRPERRSAPPEKRALAERTLMEIGVPEHCGRDYLLRAAEMVWADARLLRSLTTRVYPAIAEETASDARHVERAIRHVIDVAWRTGDLEAQERLFGETIDAKRGNPTCGEMIARIADILRWEGRA